MNIPLSSLAPQIMRSVALVILEVKYFVILNMNLVWILDGLRYHSPLCTSNTNILLPFVILLKIVQKNIIEIFVRKNEVLNIGFTIVKSAVIPFIPNAFWESKQIPDFKTGQISSLGRLTRPTSTNIPSLLFITLSAILH